VSFLLLFGFAISDSGIGRKILTQSDQFLQLNNFVEQVPDLPSFTPRIGQVGNPVGNLPTSPEPLVLVAYLSDRLDDVTVPVRNGMVHWPGDPAFHIETNSGQRKGDVCTVSKMTMGAHTGTHMDAPCTFFERRRVDRPDPTRSRPSDPRA